MENVNIERDVLILGAGAAGLMCAAVAGQRGKSVALIERAEKPGKKILISGGGRCNFTNIDAKPDRYISANRHFAKSALSRYTARDFLVLVKRHKIAFHEKTLGQLFCDDSASQILDMLLDECERAKAYDGKVTLHCNRDITEVSHADGQFTVTTSEGSFSAAKLVIATGGPSIPKMGATSFAYELGRQFGMKIVEPRPALVPFTLSDDDLLFRELSGVAADTIVSFGKTRFREASLFTHRGLSGPAILQISSYWKSGEPVSINFLPDHKPGWLVDTKRAAPGTGIRSALKDALPARLVEALAEKLVPEYGVGRDLGNVPDKDLQAAEAALFGWKFHPNGTEGFAKAEVTIGGISTSDLSSKTMESKTVPGLYAIGEGVDVTGWLGGYNFQWGWASGQAAGNAI